MNQTEVCEARTLLAAAMTPSTTAPQDLNVSSDMPSPSKISKFIIDSRWTRTATNGSGLTQGDPTTLTWSLPADGVTTDPFTNPNAPNNLRAFLDTNFPGGSGNDLTQRPWFHIFDKSLGRLEELSGVTYNYVTQDDGVPMTFNNMGILGQRADVRIMGKNLDNPFNTLAYNAFPDDGDMTIDTSEVDYFTNGENDFRAFRNVLMHEFMHGLGVDHMESSNADILMEPTANNSFDGPQLDDILALQRSYGDALEERGGNTVATAIELRDLTQFGSYSAGRFGDSLSVSPEQTDFVSIDDETDQDFYKFTIGDVGAVTITLSPRGTTYMAGPQNAPGRPVVPQTSFNSKNQSDLTLKLLGEDGVTVLQTRNVGGLGVNEVIQNFQLTSPGTYYIQVTGANTDKIQLYGLDMTYSRAPGNHFYGTIFNDVDRDNVFDSGETGVANIRAYIDTNNNDRFDTGEPSGFSVADGTYAITGGPSGGIALRIELPPNRQSTLPPDWNDELVMWIGGGLGIGSSVPDNNFGSFALPVGTAGNDAFVLTYSPNNVTITLSTNSGAASTIGTFPLTAPLVVDGREGTDSVRIVGTSGLDEFYVASANAVLTNDHQVTLAGIEQVTLAGAAGNDSYIFDTDAALGTFTLDESGGGKDLLDFFLSDLAVTVNLGLSTTQVVNTNLSLILGATNTFEDVEGGKGADKLTGNALSNMLSGNDGDDDLIGLAGDDTLKGGKQSDLYLFDADTQLGADSIVELVNEGFDLLDFHPTSTALQVDLGITSQQTVNGNLKLTLSANNVIDDVDGGSGNDRITGNALGNFLDGFGGNDVLIGLAGADELDGMQGDDTYVFANNGGFDVIKEAASLGTDTFDFSALASNVTVNLGLTTDQPVHGSAVLAIQNATAIENVIGGSGNDTITGNSLANNLNGGPGHDTLNGATGHDTLVGGNGNDTYSFATATAAGNNTISEVGTTGVDTISFSSITSATSGMSINLGQTAFQRIDALRFVRLDGASAIENVVGGSGNDTITGNALANNLNGGPGNDTLNGAAGHDTLIGGNGNDTYTFATATAAGNNIISEVGTTGVDTISFSSITSATSNVSINLGQTAFQRMDSLRFVRLDGASAIENVIGGSGNDTITGNALANNLNGGPGNDTLNGAAGHDTLIGGHGNDTYTFAAATAAGNSVISEVGTNGVDTINFSSITSPTSNMSIKLDQTTFQRIDDLRFARLDGASAIENVIGGSGNDTIIGNALGNNLNGGPGNDRLQGEAGNDSLAGGTGYDTYVFVTASTLETETITEAASAGTDTLDFSAVTANLLLSLETNAAQSVHTNRTLTLNSATAFENVIGGSGHDVLIGNSLSNRLTGNNGRDILVGNLGTDVLLGGNDDDILVAGTVNIAAMSTTTITFPEFYSTLRQSWIGTLVYPDRVQRVKAPQTPSAGKVVYLESVSKTLIPRNVLDDGVRDEMAGNSGLDLFFSGALDAVLDRASGEVLDVVTAP